MTDRAPRPHGFTLLELVLALSALALLAAICYGAFHLGWRVVQRGEVAVVTAQRLRVASDTIIRQIKSTAAYTVRNRDDDLYPYFFGTPTWIKFVTTGGLGQGGGLTRVVYRLEDDPPRLLLEETRDFTNDSLGQEREGLGLASEHATVLLDGFKGLRFQYMLNESGDTEWRDSWSGSAEELLPAAVRIIVQGMPGLEVEEWGQEIPLMSMVVGDDPGGPDDDAVQDHPEEEEEEGAGAAGGGGTVPDED